MKRFCFKVILLFLCLGFVGSAFSMNEKSKKQTEKIKLIVKKAAKKRKGVNNKATSLFYELADKIKNDNFKAYSDAIAKLCPEETELYINGSLFKLKTIPKDIFKKFKKLNKIRIVGDYRLKIIKKGAFSGLEKLKELTIKIAGMDAYRNDSKLKIEDGSFEGLDNLEFLEISNSNINGRIFNTEFGENLFSDLKNLKFLFIDAKNTNKIKGLGNLKKLERLSITYNPKKGIDLKSILTLKKLREIRLTPKSFWVDGPRFNVFINSEKKIKKNLASSIKKQQKRIKKQQKKHKKKKKAISLSDSSSSSFESDNNEKEKSGSGFSSNWYHSSEFESSDKEEIEEEKEYNENEMEKTESSSEDEFIEEKQQEEEREVEQGKIERLEKEAREYLKEALSAETEKEAKEYFFRASRRIEKLKIYNKELYYKLRQNLGIAGDWIHLFYGRNFTKEEKVLARKIFNLTKQALLKSDQNSFELLDNAENQLKNQDRNQDFFNKAQKLIEDTRKEITGKLFK